jgi:ABC-type transport system involved in multi-copper enzyme maturation permease subunit
MTALGIDGASPRLTPSPRRRSRLWATVRGLSPARLFFNPIFQKEVRTSGRGLITYWARGLYAVLLLGLVIIVFLGLRDELRWQSAAGMQVLQQLAPGVTLAIVWFQFVALAIIAPVLTAPSICEEKRARTLSDLLTTPLTSAQVVFGKLTSRTVQIVILALIATPLLLAVRVFGGLDAEVVISTTCLSLSTALLGAALGLMYSVWHARAASAVMFAIFSLGLLQAGPIVLTVILAQSVGWWGGNPPMWMFATCSPAIMVATSIQVTAGTGPIPLTPIVWLLSTGYNLGLAAIVCIFATSALRKVMLAQAGGGPSATRRRWWQRRRRAVMTLPQSADEPAPTASDEPVRLADRSRDVGDQPILWREVRQSAFGGKPRRLHAHGILLLGIGAFLSTLMICTKAGPTRDDLAHAWQDVVAGGYQRGIPTILPVVIQGAAVIGLWIFLVCRWRRGVTLTMPDRSLVALGIAASLLALLYITVGFAESGLHATLAVIAFLGMLFQAALLTSAGISGEREARTWEVLLTTPLTPRQIIMGKFVGALRRQAFIPAILLVHAGVAIILGAMSPRFLFHIVLIASGPIICFTALGLLLSLLLRRSTPAAVINLGLAFLLWLGSWPILFLIQERFGLDHWDVGFYNTLINPVVMAALAADGAFFEVPYRQVGRSLYEFSIADSKDLSAGPFTLYAIVVWLGYAAVAALALLISTRVFRRSNQQPS